MIGDDLRVSGSQDFEGDLPQTGQQTVRPGGRIGHPRLANPGLHGSVGIVDRLWFCPDHPDPGPHGRGRQREARQQAARLQRGQ